MRRLRADERPGIADDDPTIADRYKRCVPAIAEKRSEDQLSSAASKGFKQADTPRNFETFRFREFPRLIVERNGIRAQLLR